MFRVGDKIVHPMHGAGVIYEIISEKINGVIREYYMMKLPAGGMIVMIPTQNSGDIGVRAILAPDEAEQVMEDLKDIPVDMTQNWNHRYRENMLRIKSGDLREVARVVKGLMIRDGNRGLSTGERKMLHSAKQILLSELVLSQSISYEEAEERINVALH